MRVKKSFAYVLVAFSACAFHQRFDEPEKWARLMRNTLAFNGSYFNTNRMVKQYTRNAYYPVRLVERAKVAFDRRIVESIDDRDRLPGAACERVIAIGAFELFRREAFRGARGVGAVVLDGIAFQGGIIRGRAGLDFPVSAKVAVAFNDAILLK